jgi:hypothetical protein
MKRGKKTAEARMLQSECFRAKGTYCFACGIVLRREKLQELEVTVKRRLQEAPGKQNIDNAC